VFSAQFSSDGRHLLTACDDGLVRIWTTADWTVDRVLKHHAVRLWTARYSADDSRIAACGTDGVVTVWDGEECGRAEWIVRDSTPPSSFTVLGDGQRAVVGMPSGELHVFDLQTRERVASVAGEGESIAQVLRHHDPHSFISQSASGHLKRWKIVGEQVQLEAQHLGHHVRNMSHDGRWLVTEYNRELVLIDGDTLAFVRSVCPGELGGSAFIDGERGSVVVPSADADNRPALTPPDRWWHWTGEMAAIRGTVKYSWDGQIVVARNGPSSLDIYRSSDSTRISTLTGRQTVITAWAIAPTKETVATGSNEGTVVVWDVATSTAMFTMRFPGPVRGVEFSPAGSRLVAVGAGEFENTCIQVWDAPVD